MDQELVLFRDDQGRPGLLALHCSHRGADLSYGRLEDGGLRCIYHGWLYDRDGRCLEQPGEPAGSTFQEKIRHPAYPCQEAAGIIFAYLGPGEPPLLPAFEFLQASLDRALPTKRLHECNYLQGNEGSIDPSHQSFLHRLSSDTRGEHGVRQILNARATSPIIETEDTDFGVRIYAVRKVGDDQNNVRISNYILPNAAAVAGDKFGYLVQWHVPIDDTHHYRYQLWFRHEMPFTDEERAESSSVTLLPGFRMTRNVSNHFLQDREEMKSQSFAGLGPNFMVHDACAIEGAGPIQNRTDEHLGYGDRAISAARQMMFKALDDISEGQDPPGVVRDPSMNSFPHLFVRRDLLLPASVEWMGYWSKTGPVEGETWDLIGSAVPS
jgi:phenylpropionate dioxygenase-like ring-hydroxylating dioxygenase large terminal subunit